MYSTVCISIFMYTHKGNMLDERPVSELYLQVAEWQMTWPAD